MDGTTPTTWREREALVADARRRREEYWRERDAINARHDRRMGEPAAETRAVLAAAQAEPTAEQSYEAQRDLLTSILDAEIRRLGVPLPDPVARAGAAGIDTIARRLLVGKGILLPGRSAEINTQLVPPDRYRQAVRDAIDLLRSGSFDLRELRFPTTRL